MGTNKIINFVPSSIPQPTPPAVRVHLMQLVERIGKRERSKGKKLTENISKVPHLISSKVMTSLSSPGQKAEERNAQSPRITKVGTNNLEIGLDIHKCPNMNHKSPCLGLKNKGKEKEVASRLVKTKVCDVMDDDIITSPDTLRCSQGIGLVAGKPQKKGKSLLIYSVDDFGKLLMVNFRTITLVALLLAIIASVTSGLVNIRPYGRKTLIGNSTNRLPAVPNFPDAFPYLLFLVMLRILATLTCIIVGFCLYMNVNSLGNHNKRLKRRVRRLHNTRMRDKQTGYLHDPLGCHGNEMSMMQCLARPVLAGKCLRTYIYLFTHFWAVRMFYISRYTINLGLGDNYQVLINRIYLYTYLVYHSWVSCKRATHFANIFTKSSTLAYFLSNIITLVIKSHDKYQSSLLVGLGRAERANWEKRSIFGHNRSYWRELISYVILWRWSCCINAYSIKIPEFVNRHTTFV